MERPWGRRFACPWRCATPRKSRQTWGLARSTTELTVRGLHDLLEAVAQRALLDAHYQQYPDAKPDLAEVALAAAEMDGNPLAERPDLVRRAASEIVGVTDDPTPDDVLIYAAGLAAAA